MPSHKNAEDRRAYHREYMRKRYQADAAHRLKQQVRASIGHAIRDKRMTRSSCEQCGSGLQVEAHHSDYTKPLEIIWLCRKCHEAVHGGAGCHG